MNTTRNCRRECPEIFGVAQSCSTSFGPPNACPRSTSVPINYAKSLVTSSYNRSLLNESSTSCQRTPGAYNVGKLHAQSSRNYGTTDFYNAARNKPTGWNCTTRSRPQEFSHEGARTIRLRNNFCSDCVSSNNVDLPKYHGGECSSLSNSLTPSKDCENQSNIIHNVTAPASDACPYELARSAYWTLYNSKYRSNTDDGFHSDLVASSEVDGRNRRSGGICPSTNAHAFPKYASTSQFVSDTSGFKSEHSEPSPTCRNFYKSYSSSLCPLYNSQGPSEYVLKNCFSFDPSNSDISEFKSGYNVPSSRTNYHSGSFWPLGISQRNPLTDQSMFDRHSFVQSNNEFNTTTRAVNTDDLSSADNNCGFQPGPLYGDRCSYKKPGMFDPLLTVPKSSSEEMWVAEPSGVMRSAAREGACLPCEAVELGRRLLAAADQGLEEEVRALLDAGAAVDFRGAPPGRWTALQLAAMGGHPRVVALLLGRGASLRICGPLGFSALHVAAFKDYSGWCVRLLIDAGAELDARNHSGRTPLHFAAEYSNKAAVRALLQAGANTSIKTHNKKTARDVATSKRIRRILDVFTNRHLPVF